MADDLKKETVSSGQESSAAGTKISELIYNELKTHASYEGVNVENLRGKNPVIDRLLEGKFNKTDYTELEAYVKETKGIIPDAPEDRAIKTFVIDTFLRHQDFFVILAKQEGKDIIVPENALAITLNEAASTPTASHYDKLNIMSAIIRGEMDEAIKNITILDQKAELVQLVLTDQIERLEIINKRRSQSGTPDPEIVRQNEIIKNKIAALKIVRAQKEDSINEKQANALSMDIASGNYIMFAFLNNMRQHSLHIVSVLPPMPLSIMIFF